MTASLRGLAMAATSDDVAGPMFAGNRALHGVRVQTEVGQGNRVGAEAPRRPRQRHHDGHPHRGYRGRVRS